jgi:lipopolysaccharide/colanic/teichoic acid biosynthesis glycosyltransferase
MSVQVKIPPRAAELPHAAAPAARPAGVADVARRALDVVLALTMLLVLAPVMLLVALAICIDSRGPVLFRQRRLGRGMREFTVLKFRSMKASADAKKHRDYVTSLISGAGNGTNEQGGLYKLAVDDRITGVGRILRMTSLDELPQLWNVVRGEMSLVGPRPVIAYEAEQYPDWYLGRFAVRPGLTGLWQVSGRNERTYEEMVRLDLEYAERRTLGLDLMILLKTVWVVLRRKGVA